MKVNSAWRACVCRGMVSLTKTPCLFIKWLTVTQESLVEGELCLACVCVQRDALHKRVGEMAEAAALCGVNVLCMQEAWSE